MRRAATLEMYEDEIEAAYDALESEISGSESALPQLVDETAVLQYVRDAVSEVMKKRIGDGEDLFDRGTRAVVSLNIYRLNNIHISGMDSLSALTLRSSMLQIIRAARPNSNVPRNVIYHHSTIVRLAAYIKHGEEGADSIAAKMDRLVEMFTEGVSNSTAITTGSVAPANGLTVLLTGSTGTFGSQVLATLLQNPRVARVVCANRYHPSLDMLSRQRSQMDDPGLLDAHHDKLEFTTVDMSQDGLGLDKDMLEMVRYFIVR